PGRPGLADVPEDLVVHQEVAQVGGVELLLVIDRTGAGPQCDAAVAGDDLLDDRLLPLDVGLGALEADVGDAHLLGGVPALGTQKAVSGPSDRRGQGGLSSERAIACMPRMPCSQSGNM